VLLRRRGWTLRLFAAREKYAPRINSGLHQYVSSQQVEVLGLLKGSHIGLLVKRWLTAIERRRCATLLDILRRPDDARNQLTYKGPMVGKTDRFVLVFKKSAP
jgi:hypothetical protein